ncbi:hypothetical protein PoB_006264500 [Plakobranchus ocellatus]|uniref:Uncharacterized protein n=1 Tax=Plakobranchus ocellatus TaxID=259542 RepID=A0AAV4CWH1_9GAST|nr:hypothetical protein PoB_006264500 [Plakobranchus ocellatus]
MHVARWSQGLRSSPIHAGEARWYLNTQQKVHSSLRARLLSTVPSMPPGVIRYQQSIPMLCWRRLLFCSSTDGATCLSSHCCDVVTVSHKLGSIPAFLRALAQWITRQL